uniref:Uncharacterized protein n=1 Tax=Rhizophora mucronata TaxID=61149 RepID=A0A2P2Q568_RHIMU
MRGRLANNQPSITEVLIKLNGLKPGANDTNHKKIAMLIKFARQVKFYKE